MFSSDIIVYSLHVSRLFECEDSAQLSKAVQLLRLWLARRCMGLDVAAHVGAVDYMQSTFQSQKTNKDPGEPVTLCTSPKEIEFTANSMLVTDY